MYNLLGSHDTSRIGWMLRKISDGDAVLAARKQALLAALQYTYPGVPAVYAGDELGIVADSQWDGSIYQDDPFNRATMPWPELGFEPDAALLAHYQALGALRAGSPALRRGDYRHLLADDSQRLFAFERWTSGAEADRRLVLLHRGPAPATLNLPVDLPEGSVLIDDLSGASHSVSGGALSLPSGGLQAFVLRVADTGDTGEPGEPEDGADGAGEGGADGAGEGGASGADGGATDVAEGNDDGAAGASKGSGGCAQAGGAAGTWALGLGALPVLGRRRRACR